MNENELKLLEVSPFGEEHEPEEFTNFPPLVWHVAEMVAFGTPHYGCNAEQFAAALLWLELNAATNAEAAELLAELNSEE